jgi:type VI secretion system protein ImpK
MRLPVFADWPRRPLQEELFGHHVAGEVFFQNLQKLLGRNESLELADVLEVYYLCLLLGFAGRYSMGGRGELKAASDSVSDKIRRIRRIPAELSPSGGLPSEKASAAGTDPWIKGLIIGAAACLLLVVALFIGFKVALGSGVSALEAIAGQGRG